MRLAEGRGRTLDEAVDAALITLGESRRNVDVKILSESPEETHVEVTVIEPVAAATAGAVKTEVPATADGLDAAKEIVGGLLQRMGIRCSVTSRIIPNRLPSGIVVAITSAAKWEPSLRRNLHSRW